MPAIATATVPDAGEYPIGPIDPTKSSARLGGVIDGVAGGDGDGESWGIMLNSQPTPSGEPAFMYDWRRSTSRDEAGRRADIPEMAFGLKDGPQVAAWSSIDRPNGVAARYLNGSRISFILMILP